MNLACLQRAEAACPSLFGLGFADLLAPIDGAVPGGKCARTSGVHRAIVQARRADDTSLPMGAWERGLKRADWDKVSAMAVDALAHHSKDLQLAAWLLEAQINKHRFAGVAAALRLLQQLCDSYWDDLYPQNDQGSLEHRANVFRWINEKLLAALRQVPLTAGAHGFGLADWERARRSEQARVSHPSADDADGANKAELAAAMAATPTGAYLDMERQLGDALAALEALAHTITERFGAEAPSIGAFGSVLEQIRTLLDTELHRRGVRREAAPAEVEDEDKLADALPVVPAAMAEAPSGAIRSRAQAYARLEEAAQFLLQVEPHSPVPYLLQRAGEWGQFNAAELYQELFIRLGGQINVFELLGLQAKESEQA